MAQVKSVSDLNTFVDSFCSTLKEGDIIVLDGDLGAGKTHFVKAAGLFFNVEDEIVSPTFPIVIEHYGDIQLNHFDLYRLERSTELRNIGFYDYLNSDGICFIEWGTKFPHEIPDYATYVNISILSECEREVTVSNWKTVKSNFL